MLFSLKCKLYRHLIKIYLDLFRFIRMMFISLCFCLKCQKIGTVDNWSWSLSLSLSVSVHSPQLDARSGLFCINFLKHKPDSQLTKGLRCLNPSKFKDHFEKAMNCHWFQCSSAQFALILATSAKMIIITYKYQQLQSFSVKNTSRSVIYMFHQICYQPLEVFFEIRPAAKFPFLLRTVFTTGRVLMMLMLICFNIANPCK